MKKLLYPLVFALSAFLFVYSCSKDEDATPPPQFQQLTPEPPAPKQFTLTVIAGEGGTVSTEGGTYDEGTEVTITATPNEDYEFDGWEGSDSEENSITITINSNQSLSALFSLKKSIFYFDFDGLNISNTVHLFTQYENGNFSIAGNFFGNSKGVIRDISPNTDLNWSLFFLNFDLNGNINWVNSIPNNNRLAQVNGSLINNNELVITGNLKRDDDGISDINKNQIAFFANLTNSGSLSMFNVNEDLKFKLNDSNLLLMAHDGVNFISTATEPDGYLNFLVKIDNKGLVLEKIDIPEDDNFQMSNIPLSLIKLKNSDKKGYLYATSLYTYSSGLGSSDIKIIIYDENFNVTQNFTIYVEKLLANDFKIVSLPNGDFICLISQDYNGNYYSVLRKYDSNFNIIWDKIIENYGLHRDLKVDDDFIYTSGFKTDSYIFSKKYKTSDGSLEWEFKQNTTARKTIIRTNHIVDDMLILIGTVNENEGFFNGNESGGENLMVIKLNKETGDLY